LCNPDVFDQNPSGSRSQAYQIERNNALFYPDENFAQEIMQLFSIGLFMLNKDNMQKFDPISGKPIPSYTNEDIVNFSCGWTNFKEREKEQDNIEAKWSLVSNSTFCFYTIYVPTFSITIYLLP
jgi:uncharacterized protein (DUF1800 family)